MPKAPNHAMDHVAHVHDADGNPPASLSEHLRDTVNKGIGTVEHYAGKAKELAENLTGYGEVKKIGADLTGSGD